MADYVATGNPPFINIKLSIAEWNTYVANYNFGAIPPSRVVLHHTWSPTVAQWKGLTSMKGMQTYYAGLGWTAAPHIYTGPDGIWLATPMRDVGIHAGMGNSGVWNGKWSYSIGLEMVGDYDAQRPSGAVWEHAKAVMGGLSRRLGIAPRNLIFFHRDFSSKSCPGWAVTKDWVWGEVEAWLKNVSPPPSLPPRVRSGFPLPMSNSSSKAFSMPAINVVVAIPVNWHSTIMRSRRGWAYRWPKPHVSRVVAKNTPISHSHGIRSSVKCQSGEKCNGLMICWGGVFPHRGLGG